MDWNELLEMLGRVGAEDLKLAAAVKAGLSPAAVAALAGVGPEEVEAAVKKLDEVTRTRTHAATGPGKKPASLSAEEAAEAARRELGEGPLAEAAAAWLKKAAAARVNRRVGEGIVKRFLEEVKEAAKEKGKEAVLFALERQCKKEDFDWKKKDVNAYWRAILKSGAPPHPEPLPPPPEREEEVRKALELDTTAREPREPSDGFELPEPPF